jgi:hypothetical protein
MDGVSPMRRIQAAELLLLSTMRRLRVGNRFRVATYAMAALGGLVAWFASNVDAFAVLLIAAMLCGWSELDGLCGTSHVMALTPLRALDRTHRLWCKAAAAYTVSGVVTAACIGAVLAVLGRTIGLTPRHTMVGIAVLSVIFAARELGWITFELPQVRRQTNRMWAMQFGFVPGAAMWGAHIGIGFATVINHGGFFVLVAFALSLDAKLSSILMATYWVGRTLPIWLTPLLVTQDSNGGALGDLVLEHQTPYRHIAALGLLIAGSVALGLAQAGQV